MRVAPKWKELKANFLSVRIGMVFVDESSSCIELQKKMYC